MGELDLNRPGQSQFQNLYMVMTYEFLWLTAMDVTSETTSIIRLEDTSSSVNSIVMSDCWYYFEFEKWLLQCLGKCKVHNCGCFYHGLLQFSYDVITH